MIKITINKNACRKGGFRYISKTHYDEYYTAIMTRIMYVEPRLEKCQWCKNMGRHAPTTVFRIVNIIHARGNKPRPSFICSGCFKIYTQRPLVA